MPPERPIFLIFHHLKRHHMPLRAGFRSVWLDAKINAKGNFPKSFVRSFSSGAVLHGFGEIITLSLWPIKRQLHIYFEILQKIYI